MLAIIINKLYSKNTVPFYKGVEKHNSYIIFTGVKSNGRYITVFCHD